MSYYATEYPTIEFGKLCIRTYGGSIMPIGVRAARAGIRQIEASKLPLCESTKRRLAVLKEGVVMWEAR